MAKDKLKLEKNINNKKKDVALRVMLILGIVLSIVMMFVSVIANNGEDFAIDNIATIEIASFDELKAQGESIHNKSVELAGDITIDDANFSIGTRDYPYKGVFDGNGHTVLLAFDKVSDNNVLFAYTTKDVIIKNVNFAFTSDITVDTASYSPIIKNNLGKIEDCKMTFSNMILTKPGVFSPIANVNNGTIKEVAISGKITSTFDKESEKHTYIGYGCAYNYGTLDSVLAYVDYDKFNITDAEKVFKGIVKNMSIAGVRASDVDNGKTSHAVVIKDETIFVSDVGTDIKAYPVSTFVITEDIAFNELNFDNQNWKISDGKLELVIKEVLA